MELIFGIKQYYCLVVTHFQMSYNLKWKKL